MKKTIRLTESELQQIIKECVLQYNPNIMCESKLGKIARTTALGLGLTGGMLGGINDANAQRANKQPYSRQNIEKKLDSIENDIKYKNTPFYQNLQQKIDKDMEGKMELQKYRDSIRNNNTQTTNVDNNISDTTNVNNNNTQEDIETLFGKINPMLTSNRWKYLPKGNGSTNPNDYKYKLVITTNSRSTTDTITLHTTTFQNYEIKTKGVRSNFETMNKTTVFEHTFDNFDIFCKFLPKIISKLDYNDGKNEIFYDFDISIEGMTVEDYDYSSSKTIEKTYVDWNSYGSGYGSYINNQTIKTIKTSILKIIKQYGDYQNQYRTDSSLGCDMNGNEIYVDKYGNKYTWDDKIKNFKPAKVINTFTLDDLNETISHIIKDKLY